MYVWRQRLFYFDNHQQEESITKLQTGGPDGDLGSNEIKISKDKTMAIVDGSGVLFDRDGIDRPELLRLANARQMVSNFDMSKLGKNGFRILVDETNVRLPGMRGYFILHRSYRSSTNFLQRVLAATWWKTD